MSKLEIPTDRPPLFVSAGIIKEEEQIDLYAGVPEIAAQVLGSYSVEEHEPPVTGKLFHYDEAEKAAYNAFRLRNPGHGAASRYLPEGIKKIHDAGQVAIVGVVALEHEDPLEVLPKLVSWGRETGADGVEVNVSCPNDGEALICANLDKTLQIFETLRTTVGHDFYLMAKFSSLGEATIRQYKRERLAVDAVAAINGPRQRSPIDPQTGERAIGVNDGWAGKSGPAITTATAKNLRGWLRPVDGPADFPVSDPQYDVWSVGGIEDGSEGYRRVHDIGAFAFGAAQAFYRAADPGRLAQRLAAEYQAAAESASPKGQLVS